jgi:hypothetical protein
MQQKKANDCNKSIHFEPPETRPRMPSKSSFSSRLKNTYIIMRSSRKGTNSLAEQQITPHDPLPAASYR